MNSPLEIFRTRLFNKQVKAAGLDFQTEADLNAIIEEIAKSNCPIANYRVGAIRCAVPWHRIKAHDHDKLCEYRVIVEFNEGRNQMVLLLFLKRTSDTYQIVRHYWEQLVGGE